MTRTANSPRVSRRLAAALALTGALAVAGQAMAIPVDDDDDPRPPRTPGPARRSPRRRTPWWSRRSWWPRRSPPTRSPRTVTDTVIRFGATVQFSAAGSTDSDGAIVKYEWDLDGQPGFETTTTTPRTPARYTATGTSPRASA